MKHEKTIAQIREALDRMEEVHRVETPDWTWFEQVAERERNALRVKQRREFIWFSVAALTTSSLLAIVFYLEPTTFVWLQAMGIAGVAAVWSRSGKGAGANDATKR